MFVRASTGDPSAGAGRAGSEPIDGMHWLSVVVINSKLVLDQDF